MPLVLLASASERRRALMSEFFGIDGIELIFSTLEEAEPEPSARLEVCLQVEASCLQKARAAASEQGTRDDPSLELIVVSDTLVEDPDDSRVALGKPKDKMGAASTLIRLSGRRHKVWSSTAIMTRNGTGVEVGFGWQAKIWTDFSIVEFDEISGQIMEDLIGSDSWIGKAGGYDLAGKAESFSRTIEGEDVTVLGFSTSAIEELKNMLV
jgi:septum formation protein